MQYKINILKKLKHIFSQTIEENDLSLTATSETSELNISKAFFSGSGKSSAETKRAFKAMSSLVLPYLSPRKDFHSAIKMVMNTPPFESKTVNRKKIICFVFQNTCYEIPQNSGELKLNLIEESGIFNYSWGEGNPFNTKDVQNFEKFMSDNSIVSVADYDNFLKQKVYINVNGKLYFLFPRLSSNNNPGLKEILKSKLSLKATTQLYGGEILTKQVLEQYLTENDFSKYYNIIDSTDHTFARIENFVISDKGQEVLDQYSKINFSELREIIEKNYFFDDPLLEFAVYVNWIGTTPYYNPIRSLQKEPVRRTLALKRISELYEKDETESKKAVNEFREGLNKIVQDLVFISELKRGDLEKYYYLVDALMAIKFFHYRDRNRQISDKINLNSMKADTFETSLLDKKADFLLMPVREYHKILPIILVEFDGEQHFKPKLGRNFVRIKFYDAIKNNFFNNTPGFSIIRIPYTLVKDSPTKDYKPAIMEYIKPDLDKIIKNNLMLLERAAIKIFNFKKTSYKQI